jgi:hypothetical protein
MMNDIRSLLRDSSMQCERKPIDDFCDLPSPQRKVFLTYFANAVIVAEVGRH